MQWLRRKCFSNLKEESQRNNLLLFIIITSYLFGLGNAIANNGVMDQGNMNYYISGAVILTIGIILVNIKRFQVPYKYIMMTLLLAISIQLISVFHTHYPMFNLLYFTLAVSLIYLNERLLWYVGSLTVIFTVVGHMVWPEVFFPLGDTGKMITSSVLLFITTIALWGVTKIGKSLIEEMNVERELAHQKAAELQKTQELIDETVQKLQTSFNALAQNINTSSSSTSEIKTAFQEVATGAQNQAENMSQSVSQLQEMEEMFNEIIEQISTASTDIDHSYEEAKLCAETLQSFNVEMKQLNSVINEAGAVIRDLNNQTQQINEIVEAITGLSNQTSLLALNAAIEAARAGESGRGFAVVADEVRKLAEESQKSAVSIQEILKNFSLQASAVGEQVKKGEEVQEACNAMLENVSTNINKLGSFMSSLDKLMEGVVKHHEVFQQKTSHIVQEVTLAASVTEQTSAASEEVLASVESEATRNQSSLETIEQVSDQVKRLQTILR